MDFTMLRNTVVRPLSISDSGDGGGEEPEEEEEMGEEL